MMPYNKEEIIMNDTTTVPISEKYVLTIKEASCFFCIGENKLRRLAAEAHSGLGRHERKPNLDKALPV